MRHPPFQSAFVGVALFDALIDQQALAVEAYLTVRQRHQFLGRNEFAEEELQHRQVAHLEDLADRTLGALVESSGPGRGECVEHASSATFFPFLLEQTGVGETRRLAVEL